MKLRPHRARKLLCLTVVSLFVTGLPIAANAVAQSDPPKSIPSWTTLKAAVSASSLVTRAPASSTILPSPLWPGLWWKSINPAESSAAHSGCDLKDSTITVPSSPKTKCAYGDLNASRTLLLTGDSNAAMWIPAFDTWGFQSHWKVITLTHASCPPWRRPWLPGSLHLWGGVTVAGCETWRQAVLKSAKTFHPSIVVPVGITTSGGTSAKSVTQAQLTVALKNALTEIKRAGLKPVTLDPIPSFRQASNALACLSLHSNSLTSCEVSTSSLGLSKLNTAYAAATRATSVPLTATRSLFCGPSKCPLLVKLGITNYLVYQNGDHMTHQYSQILGTALGTALAPYLPKN